MTVRLSGDLDEHVAEIAAREGMTKAEVVREAIRAYAARRDVAEVRRLARHLDELTRRVERIERRLDLR